VTKALVKASASINSDGWFCAAILVSRGERSEIVTVPGDAGRPFRSKASAIKYAKEALSRFDGDPKFAERMATNYL